MFYLLEAAGFETSFTGYFTDHHAFLLQRMLARVDAIDAGIAALDSKIEEMIAPFAAAAQRLDEIPGINSTAACVILAEIGIDMGRFPTAGHLVSWAKFAPGVKESAGKKKGKNTTGARQFLPGAGTRQRGRLRRPDRHLPRRAVPAHRTPARQKESRGRHRPVHSGHHLTWHLLADPGARYTDLGGDFYDTRINPERRRRSHIRQLESPRLQGHPRTRGLTTEARPARLR